MYSSTQGIVSQSVQDVSKSSHFILLALVTAIPLAYHFSDPHSSPIKIGNQASTAARRSISMAWRSSGTSNEALIENLASNGLINSDRVKKAMLGVRSSRLCLAYVRLTLRRSTEHIMRPTHHTKTRLNRSATERPFQHHTCMPRPVSHYSHI